MELLYLLSPTRLIVFYNCIKFREIIVKLSQKISGLVSGHDLSSKNFKRHNSVKFVGGVTVFILCTLSDCALYLYKCM